MPSAPCDKHIKSSSQEKASSLAAAVAARCQEEPEDETKEEEVKIVNKSHATDHQGRQRQGNRK